MKKFVRIKKSLNELGFFVLISWLYLIIYVCIIINNLKTFCIKLRFGKNSDKYKTAKIKNNLLKSLD